MATGKSTVNAQKTQLNVYIGKEGLPVGELAYVKDGTREYSAFAYGQEWLRHPSRFDVSPDLVLAPGHQVRKPPTKDDSRFFLALADTEPDALAVLADVHGAVTGWRSLAMSAEVGLTAAEVEEFAPAFEHAEMDRVKTLLSFKP